MKLKYTFLQKLLVIILAVFIFSPDSASQNLLNRPESVIYDSLYNRYLVSNWANGSIVQIDSNGVQSYFVTGHGSINGVWIAENIIFAGCSTKVKGFSLSDSSMVMDLAIPGAININDITSDNSGNIYLTDFNARKIYKVNIQSHEFSTIVSGLSRFPNGIIYEEDENRLLFCSFGSNIPILAYNLYDSSLTTVANTTLKDCDGFAKDDFGNYYVTSWDTRSIYKFDSAFTNPPEVFYTNAGGCADISYNSVKDELAVAVMNYNQVKFLPVDPVSVGKGTNDIPEQFYLYQNFPNPFNPVTTIRYDIAEQSYVTLKVFDALGKELLTLVNEEKNAGIYEVNFKPDVFQLSSGIYFYRLMNGNFTGTKKMLILK